MITIGAGTQGGADMAKIKEEGSETLEDMYWRRKKEQKKYVALAILMVVAAIAIYGGFI